jgi:hypothetical protein
MLTALLGEEQTSRQSSVDAVGSAGLGPPEVLESFLAEFGVACGVLDCAMTKPILNCSRVVPSIGERVAAGVPQHVDVNLKGGASALTDALD